MLQIGGCHGQEAPNHCGIGFGDPFQALTFNKANRGFCWLAATILASTQTRISGSF